jgi:Domain of unknown function (DUF3943)
VSRAWARIAATIVALCFSLGVVPVSAEETPFVLLPDKTLVSADTADELKGPSRDWVGLGRDTLFLLGYQVVTIGVFYVLPESVSKWSDDQKKHGADRWWSHVRNPTWDSDNPVVNYIGHPYFGAAYYTRARERGFGEFDSFLYSALASTMYEFGVEAIFERPSLQDLMVTPIGGALLGFAWEPLRNWIKRKPERAWYDHLGLIATDPIGTLNGAFEWLLGIKSDLRVDIGRDGRFHVELRVPLN